MSRLDGLLERLHRAGLVRPTKGSRRFPPECGEYDATALLIAVLADRGLDAAADNAWALAAIDCDGQRFSDWLMDLLYGPPRHIQHLAVQHEPPAASVVFDGQHMRFGGPVTTAGRIVPGTTLAALAAELQGATQNEADAIAALTNIRRAYAQH